MEVPVSVPTSRRAAFCGRRLHPDRRPELARVAARRGLPLRLVARSSDVGGQRGGRGQQAKADIASKKDDYDSDSSDTSAETFVAIASSFAAVKTKAKSWTIDSGASHHMTPHKEFLVDLKSATGSVRIGDDQLLDAQQSGTAVISTPQG